MASYLAAWKAFRQAANENKRIARHLVSRPQWPRRPRLRICDIGCGDGRLLETLILEAPDELGAVVLVDPDTDLLDEAVRAVTELNLVPEVIRIPSTAESAFPSCAADSDIVLMIHVVYLMESEHFAELLGVLSTKAVTYIVLDEPESIFTTLWEKTAPKFYDRVLKAHRFIQSLPPERFQVKESKIQAEVPNPFSLPREDLRRAILSLLCYSSGALDDPRAREWIERTVNQFAVADGKVACRSACYEILRKT
jgi:SAM-dependent methyltransferase